MEAAAQANNAVAFVDALLSSLNPESVAQGAPSETKSEKVGQGGAGLQRAKELLGSASRIITQRLTQQAKDEVTDGVVSGSDSTVFLKMVDVPFFEPRGRFTASFSNKGLLLEGKTANCFVPWENVSHAAVFPSSTSTKKEGEDMLALRLSPSVKASGKELGGILISLSKSVGLPIKALLPSSNASDEAPIATEGVPAAIIPKLVQLLWKRPVVVPQKDLFQSVSVGPGGATRPYLRCHKGVQEGVIYPLSNGVVFVKPLLFLPAEDIASLSAGRGGGSGQTRYVDLKIEMADDNEYEFVNIEREELPALQNYVKGYLETRAKAEAERKLQIKRENGECVDEEDDGDDSDDEDDDDYDEDEDDDAEENDDDSDDSGDSEGDVGSDAESENSSSPKVKPKSKVAKKEVSKKLSSKRKSTNLSSPSIQKETTVTQVSEADGVIENEAKENCDPTVDLDCDSHHDKRLKLGDESNMDA